MSVVGSGSDGNCYILQDDKEALIVECGCKPIEVKKALDFNVSKIVGAIATHKHSDHANYVKDFEMMGVPVFTPYRDGGVAVTRRYGNFIVKAFPNKTLDGKWLHNNSDGSECPCYGFWIYHKEMGKFVYASDTECIVQRFKDINHFLIEANYSQDLVDKDSVKFSHQIQGHMSLNTCCDFLQANKSDSLRTVTLCHLSSTASDSDAFRRKARQTVGCEVGIATGGLVVNLSDSLF